MYCCWTRKSHLRTRIICQKQGFAEFLTKLFGSKGGISLSHINTYEDSFSHPLCEFCQFHIKIRFFCIIGKISLPNFPGAKFSVNVV